jgi:hypothetical protein
MERVLRILTKRPVRQTECNGTITCACPGCELRDTARQRRMIKRLRRDAKRLWKETNEHER